MAQIKCWSGGGKYYHSNNSNNRYKPKKIKLNKTRFYRLILFSVKIILFKIISYFKIWIDLIIREPILIKKSQNVLDKKCSNIERKHKNVLITYLFSVELRQANNFCNNEVCQGSYYVSKDKLHPDICVGV